MVRRTRTSPLVLRHKPPPATVASLDHSGGILSGKEGPAVSSAQTSDVNTEDAVNAIAALTLDTPLRPFKPKRRVPATPLPFLSLPSELRIKVYEYFFEDALSADTILDLGPDNYKRYHKKLGLMRVCRQVHDEATYLFYSNTTFRIFPIHPGRYFKSKYPILSRLKPNQRACISTLDLRLGPGWGAPPRGWIVNDALGLADCTSVNKLKVFVECDPSDGIFNGFRRGDGFYETFSHNLICQILEALPRLQTVEFDGWSAVSKTGPMMRGLIDAAAQSGKSIQWGPERGWVGGIHEEEPPRKTQTIAEAIESIEGLTASGSSNVVVSA